MHRELPLYIFLRNTVILCLLFFTISFVIIERGKIERGDHSIFQGVIKNKKNIRDYDSPDFSSNNNKSQEFQFSTNQKADTLNSKHSINSTLVRNNTLYETYSNGIDL